MKRFYKKLLAVCAVSAALLLAASCSKESGAVADKDKTARESAPEGWSGYKVKVEDNVTKTCLTADNRVAWVTGDKVKIVGAAGADLQVVPAGDDATVAYLIGSMPAARTSSVKYRAYYPAEIAAVSGDAVTLTLPETRAYASNDSPLQGSPMYAESNDDYFVFKNLCGMLELTARGSGIVKKIEILSTDATSDYMSGTFKIDASGTAVIDTTAADVSRKAIITYSGNVYLTPEGVIFYVTLPAGTYKDLIIRFFDNAGKVSGYKMTGSFPVARGQVRIADMEVSFNEGVQLWKDGPYWATKNVGATSVSDPGNYYQYGSSVKVYSDYITKPVFSPWPSVSTDYYVVFKPEYSGGWNAATANLLGLPGIRAGGYDPLPAKFDAVTKAMGAGWHIALYDDFDNLMNKCDFRRVDSLGTNLWIVTGRGEFAGNKLILPVTGYGASTRVYLQSGGSGSDDIANRVLLWSSKAIGAGKDGWSFEINTNYAQTAKRIYFPAWNQSTYQWAWPYRGTTY